MVQYPPPQPAHWTSGPLAHQDTADVAFSLAVWGGGRNLLWLGYVAIPKWYNRDPPTPHARECGFLWVARWSGGMDRCRGAGGDVGVGRRLTQPLPF